MRGRSGQRPEKKAAPAAGWTSVESIVATLMKAVQGDNVEKVKNLAAELTPQQINQTNAKGNNALMIAAKSGNDEMVEILLNKGANIDAINEEGQNALMFAANSGNVNSVEILLNKGANINAVTNNDRTTALMIAAEKGHRGVVIILAGRLSAEQIRQVNGYGKNALDIAKEKSSSCKGYTEVFEILAGILTKKSRAAAINQVPEKSHSQNPVDNEDEKDPSAGIIVSTPANKSKIKVEIEDQPGMDLKYLVRQALSQITDATAKADEAAESLEGIHLSPEEEKSLADALKNAQAMVKKLSALQKRAAADPVMRFPQHPLASASFRERIAASRNAPAAAPVMMGPSIEVNLPQAAAAPGPSKHTVGQHTKREAEDRAVDGKGRAAANRR
jgi:hypothetical protein